MDLPVDNDIHTGCDLNEIYKCVEGECLKISCLKE